MPISPSVRTVITLGDPAGIGPEVTLKALSLWKKKKRDGQFLLLGRANFFAALAKKLGLPLKFTDLPDVRSWENNSTVIPCFFSEEIPLKFRMGISQPHLTRLAVSSIRLGAKLAMEKTADAIVTPPIHKAGLKRTGFDIPGHTEFLAELSGTKRFEMMLVGGPLRTVLVTRHVPIKNISEKITKKRIEETILMADEELKESFDIRKPRLVVCGLNPHAGEAGTIGREEIEEIIPAVRSARKKTDSVITGPLSPDALFHDAYQGRYDAEICMYHDQGLIPLKMISRGFGVNVTLGLPFVRTSPDHGTAYDIAGKFIADAGSMLEAMTLAATLSKNRRRHALARSRS